MQTFSLTSTSRTMRLAGSVASIIACVLLAPGVGHSQVYEGRENARSTDPMAEPIVAPPAEPDAEPDAEPLLDSSGFVRPARVFITSDGPQQAIGVRDVWSSMPDVYTAYSGRSGRLAAVRFACVTPCAIDVLPGPLSLVTHTVGRRDEAQHLVSVPSQGGSYVIRSQGRAARGGARGLIAGGVAVTAVGVVTLAVGGLLGSNSGGSLLAAGGVVIGLGGLGMLIGGGSLAASRSRLERVREPRAARPSRVRDLIAAVLPTPDGAMAGIAGTF